MTAMSRERMHWTSLLSHQRLGGAPASGAGPRSEFQRDFDRVVFSSAFRRLQDKTQVFPLATNDSVRTRLTHSLEVASVGRTEEELKAANVAYKAGRFPFTANPRARCNAETEGMVKILSDARTDRILGVHIIGPEAGTIIHEAVVAMEFAASAEDLGRICHAHPTLNEAVKEAALAVSGQAIHI